MKKVLSLVLAAAMTMGIAATSFAAAATMDKTASDKYDTTVVATDNPVKLNTEIVRGTLKIDGNVVTDDYIPYGKTGVIRYSVTATANRFAYANSQKDPIILNVHSFDNSVRVKGPADVSDPDVDKTTFKWNYTGAHKEFLTVYYEFDVEITPTNADSVAPKGLVLDVTAKASSLAPNGSGIVKKTNTVKSLTVGYNNIDTDDLYDAVVDAFDEMVDYEETSFEANLGSNRVLPASVVKFLAKNLSSKQSAIFVMSADEKVSPTYFDGTTTLELNKTAFEALNTNKHINVAFNSNDGGNNTDVLDDAGVDYKWFNYVVHRDIVATHSVETRYEEPHVYLVSDDGTIEEVTDTTTEDYPYGDVVFTGPMGRYLISDGAIDEYLEADGTDEPIEDDDLIDEPVEDDDKLVDEDGNPIENNPGTGSSNAISLAVAMAVVSLAAAGLVASKKASK